MKLAIKEHVYELSIDGIVQTQELYADSRAAIDLAMQNICEEYDVERSFRRNPNGICVIGPLYDNCRVPDIYRWIVEIRKEEEVIRVRMLQLRRVPVITKK